MNSLWQRPFFVFLAIIALLTAMNGAFGYNGFNPSLLIAVVLGYTGLKSKRKFTLYVAAFFLVIAFVTMPIVQLIIILALVATVLYGVITFVRASTKTKLTSLHYRSLNKLAQPTVEDYQWQDFIVQRPFGNVTIDTTKTILPTGTSFISVRHGIGKVTITLPFEVGLRIQASTLLGSMNILDEPRRSFNEVVMYEEGLHLSRIVVLHLSSIAGEIEVIRQ